MTPRLSPRGSELPNPGHIHSKGSSIRADVAAKETPCSPPLSRTAARRPQSYSMSVYRLSVLSYQQQSCSLFPVDGCAA